MRKKYSKNHWMKVSWEEKLSKSSVFCFTLFSLNFTRLWESKESETYYFICKVKIYQQIISDRHSSWMNVFSENFPFISARGKIIFQHFYENFLSEKKWLSDLKIRVFLCEILLKINLWKNYKKKSMNKKIPDKSKKSFYSAKWRRKEKWA